MWANRKVVASLCNICGQGFELAQEVYACPRCEGYHHLQCWRDGMGCAAAAEEAARHEPPPQAVELASPSALGGDERLCPSCAHAIKTKAIKCRFCGTVLDTELVQQIEPQKIPSYIADEAEKTATQSLVYSIISIFLCGIFLAPVAISKGHSVLKTLREYPTYCDDTSAGTRARAGLIIGWIVFAIWILGLIRTMAKT